MKLKRGKLVDLDGLVGRVGERLGRDFILYCKDSRSLFRSVDDLTNAKSLVGKNFPSLRKLKKIITEQWALYTRYHLENNTDLSYYDLYDWAWSMFHNGIDIRNHDKPYGDHNPQWRVRYEDIVVTYYNNFKPMLVIGSNWAFKIHQTVQSVRIIRGTEADILSDPTYIIWKLSQ